jgi:antitoxin ChpS
MNISVRQQGGAAIVTIPAHVMRSLNIEVGSELEMSVSDEMLILKTKHKKRRRYTVEELFEGVTPKMMRELLDETKWARDGDPVGRELL